ncbi:MAG: SpoIID/LytB domain-containing protein [Acidimicrobiia bacterium]|nr:SpoIID/LytB domain-containing protein [Acidimicrobiia bacterium]
MTVARIAGILLGLVALVVTMPVHAREPAVQPPVEIVSIELVGDSGTRFEVDGRRYVGPLRFLAMADGLALAERASIEQYLQGIAEMPFLWPEDALQAQAVAARTYLARTLRGGRNGDAAKYAYDICATSRCQVYKGVQLVEDDHGDRWRDAVDATKNELVLSNGVPIEAVYSSSAGSRTRANQDVWASDPVPYLQPVDSPEIGVAPYATWQIELTADQFVQILRADGVAVGGSLMALDVDDPPEGLGRASLTVVTTGGTETLLAPSLRGVFNRRGDDLYPGALPAKLPSGLRLPQPLPSATYTIDHVVVPARVADRFLPEDDYPRGDRIVIDGEGWGHGVGMSQWGARAMAESGSDHSAILAHYYGGLEPEVASELVPEVVLVGLSNGRTAIEVAIDGDASLLVNGVPAGQISSGTWYLRATGDGVGVVAGDGDMLVLTDRPWPR